MTIKKDSGVNEESKKEQDWNGQCGQAEYI